MNNKVIYTCIVGDYDKLQEPQVVSADFDYVCFSDSLPIGKIGVWNVRPIPFSVHDTILLSRYPKLQPHKVLPEYEYSLYIDANIQILDGSFYDVINKHITAGDLISQVLHPYRKCVYQEIYACWHHSLISLYANVTLRYKLHRMGMPVDYGLMENCIILRRHNDSFVADVSDAWWKFFCSSSAKRDQLSLMPIYWQRNFMPTLLFEEGKNVRNIDSLRWIPHVVHRNDRRPKSAFEMFLMRLANGAERRGWL